MRVKRFEAKTMKEALQMVKNDLGPDAIILSAKDNRKSYGIAGEGSVEVTAAVSDSTLHKKNYVESRLPEEARDRFRQAPARKQKEIIDRVSERKIQEFQAKQNARYQIEQTELGGGRARPSTSANYIDIPDEDHDEDVFVQRRLDFRQARTSRSASTEDSSSEQSSPHALRRIRNAVQEAAQAGRYTVDEAPKKKMPAGNRVSGSEMPRIQTTERPDSVGQVSAVQAPRADEVWALKNEISRLQKIIENSHVAPAPIVNIHPGAEFGINFDFSHSYQKLLEVGISPEYASEILLMAQKEIDPVQAKKKALIDAWMARWFLTNINTQGQPYAGRVHLFVGCSGSGKTSTLVKMASHLVVNEKKRVAVVSTDSFKVGAVEQMKIYCQILNIPFAVIRSKNEWEWVMSQLGYCDYILIDSPGFHLQSLEEIHAYKDLLPPADLNAVTHLVLSSTNKDADALEVAKRFKIANYNDLIFSNLDQATQHGVIFNVHRKLHLPLHSFGTGHRVPEDFEVATKERVLDLIFKLTKVKREIR